MNSHKKHVLDPDITYLAQIARQGEQAAFGQLFDRLHQPLLNYLYHMLGTRQFAEDICQEAFLRAFQQISNLGPPWDFKSWLFRIASNLAIDVLRKERRLVEEEELDMEESKKQIRPTEEGADIKLQQEVVWQTLDTLPTTSRQALILHEMHNFSYEEISQSLACSYENARQIVHRARQRFREQHWLSLVVFSHPPRCRSLAELVHQFPDGKLTRHHWQVIDEHVKDCIVCQEARRVTVPAIAALALLPPLTPSQAWKSSVQQQIVRLFPGSHQSFLKNNDLPDIYSQNLAHGKAATDMVNHASIPITLKGGLSMNIWILAAIGFLLTILMLGMGGVLFNRVISHLPPKSGMMIPSPTINPFPAGFATATIQPASPAEDTASVIVVSAATPTLTSLPTIQDVIAASPTPPPTATLQDPQFTINQNAHCREGDSTDYKIIISFSVGQIIQVDGRNTEKTWWWVLLPGSRAHCWVWSGLGEINVDPADLPVIKPPPKPTPTIGQQGCWVYNPKTKTTLCIAPCPANAQPGGVCVP